MEKIDPKVLLMERNRRLCAKHLVAFTKAMYPKFQATWFHMKYYEALDAFARGEITKLMVFIPPQHGKSLGSTQMLPSYLLGRDPDLKIAIVSYNATKAEKFNRAVQRVIDTDAYRMIFPHTLLSSGTDGYQRNNLEIEMVGKEGGLRSVGVGGGLTGETVDVLIMDDLYKDTADAWSPTVRENVRDWYNAVAETRLHNNSRQLIVFTRWHHEDLAGTLLSMPEHGWRVIQYPAIKSGGPTEDDPREDGESLFPERHSIERLTAIRDRDPFIFESLYQQNPQPKEGLLYGEFKTYKELPITDRGTVKAYVDTADLGKDYLCSIAYLQTQTGVYVLDVIYTQEGMEVTEQAVARQMNEFMVNEATIESNNGGRGFARVVEEKTRILGNVRTKFTWFHQSLNKEARIVTNSATVTNIIHFPSGWGDRWPIFRNHVVSYSAKGRNAHDDAPDTLTGIVENFTGGNKRMGGTFAELMRRGRVSIY